MRDLRQTGRLVRDHAEVYAEDARAETREGREAKENGVRHYGDITKLSGYTLPIVDIITGGSPCQDLSVAGKRAGLDGERSGLFMEQIRIVKEMREHDRQSGRPIQFVRPRYCVWENVPGAFSSNGGRDFQAVLTEIARIAEPDAPDVPLPEKGRWTKSGCIYAEMGGWSIAWRVHDAQFWGVPQRRKRIALVADFGGLSAPEILFERKGLSRDSEPGEATGKATAGSVGSGAYPAIARSLTRRYDGSPCIDRGPNIVLTPDGKDTAVCLDAHCANTPGARGGQERTVVCCYDARGNGNGKTVPTLTGDHQNRVTDYTALCVGNGQLNQVSMAEQANTLDTMHDQQAVLCFQNTGQGWWNESDVGATLRTPCGGDSVKANLVAAVDCRNGTENAKVNGTLQAKSNGGTSVNLQNVCRQYNVVRRLTPLECERLQGYPDGWTDIGDWTDSKDKKHKAADSPRYKALGNSIALPFWQYLARRILAQYERDITMGSLFDGIGGFPFVFERCGAKAVWGSEIEEFPIAVTKKHFPED